MVSPKFLTPVEVASEIARRAREKRLAHNLSQQSLAERSGVSLGVIKKFEHTGKISLESVLKLAFVLESLDEFAEVFKPTPKKDYLTLDSLLKQKSRKRGRQ